MAHKTWGHLLKDVLPVDSGGFCLRQDNGLANGPCGFAGTGSNLSSKQEELEKTTGGENKLDSFKRSEACKIR